MTMYIGAGRPHQQVKPPILSDAQVNAAETGKLDAVMRELATERGYQAGKGPMWALLLASREYLSVQPVTTGQHVVRYSSPRTGERMTDPIKIAADLMAILDEREALAAFGPDPEQVLAERLQALGVPADEAKDRARHRIVRLEDGRVQGFGEKRLAVHSAPIPPKDDVEYTPEQLRGFRDHQPVVAKVTRAILSERERGLNANGTTDADAAQARQAHLDAVRSRIASSF